jgi:hypothetical protein
MSGQQATVSLASMTGPYSILQRVYQQDMVLFKVDSCLDTVCDASIVITRQLLGTRGKLRAQPTCHEWQLPTLIHAYNCYI